MSTRAVVLISLLAAACATNATSPAIESAAETDAALLARFHARVNEYMEVRREAAGSLLPLEVPDDSARIKAAQEALAASIRATRPNARQGVILSPDIRSYFRQLLAPELKGEQGRDIRARLQDDAPDPDAIPLEVNATYPPGTPFATTPSPLLLTLPPLPRGLEYRFIGRDLILLDQPANLIVDFMRNAIPARAKPA